MRRSVLAFAIFLLVITAVVAGVHYYLWHRMLRAPQIDRRWQVLGARVLIALGIAMPVSMFLVRTLPRTIGTLISYLAYTWMGIAAMLFSVLVITEIVRWSVVAGSALASRPLDEARRAFLSRLLAGAAGLVTMGLAGMGVASALGAVAVKRVAVGLRRLPASLTGFRIVQLTDVHIGPTIGKEWLAGIVERVNALEPDLVVITGDLVDGSVAALQAHVAPLADLRARFGVYFVTGNHEYYSGATEWIAELGRLGVRVLRNERVTIGDGDASFDLAGVDDWKSKDMAPGHGPDIAKACEGRDASRELILLAHQPRQIFEAAAHGVGLQISGHTHGGQIFPITLLVGLDQPYVAGLSRHEETQIYVSRGTGYWGPPMRVGAPSEITLLQLEREVPA
ncbi:metallophosphoesterase [Polyangium aurulentum]|uniref:metallophosphoesterase n=1 Tax=Polyangium aurulentum TaxID=2567896 RepID=UPI0010AEA3FA|nr:metallophosphoesterase [Polyangium aurulentum]UQA61011.1 metallophosphoesterase [Polyangium aurulentum]